jgi:hypothetical protein
MLGTLASNSNARIIYETIRTNMMKYDDLSKKIPSFAYALSNEASANTQILSYNSVKKDYELTLPDDTNNILQYFDFTGSGITADRNGSTLKLSSSVPISLSIILSAISKFIPSNLLSGVHDGMPLYWISAGNQILVSFDPLRIHTPLTAYLSVKTQAPNEPYNVYYYLENSITPVHDYKSVTGKVMGDSVTEGAVPVDGYTVLNTSSNPSSVTHTLGADGNGIIFYYTKNIPDNPPAKSTVKSIVIHYYLDGTTTPVHAVVTAEGVIGSSQTLTAPAVDGYTTVAPGTSTLKVSEGDNVVTFYYTKNIPDNTTPLGSNPATGDKGTAIPLFVALASLFTFAGITVSRVIRKKRKSA